MVSPSVHKFPKLQKVHMCIGGVFIAVIYQSLKKNCVPHHSLVPQNVTLFGNRVFTEEIKLKHAPQCEA